MSDKSMYKYYYSHKVKKCMNTLAQVTSGKYKMVKVYKNIINHTKKKVLI